MDIEKIKSENITHEEHMKNVLQDEEYQKMYAEYETANKETIEKKSDTVFTVNEISIPKIVKENTSFSKKVKKQKKFNFAASINQKCVRRSPE